MLYPRLQLAKELLRDDGVIFCSIDDRNQAYVKCLFDEVFEEGNFVCNFVWHSKNKPSGNTSLEQGIDTRTEYILCYTKEMLDVNRYENTKEELTRKGYILKDEYFNERGHYKLTPLMHSCSASSFQYLESLDYEIQAPDGAIFKNHQNVKNPKSYRYTWSKKLFDFGVQNGFIEFTKTSEGEWVANRKMYENCAVDNKKLEIVYRKSGNAYHNLITEKLIENLFSDSGANEVRSIMNKKIFANPKPVNLIKHLLKIATTAPEAEEDSESKTTNASETIQNTESSNDGLNGDSSQAREHTHSEMTESEARQSLFSTQETSQEEEIVLDFFAGSGTTAHALMELNREDGGNRRCILVTNNEITELNPNGIAIDVTSKRLKRIMSGECYDGNKDFKWREKNEPYGGKLEVYEIQEIADTDVSVFEKIDESCYGLKFTNTPRGVQDKIEWVCRNFETTCYKLDGEED